MSEARAPVMSFKAAQTDATAGWAQAPFLNGRMLMFEILCSAACLADLPRETLNA